MTEAAVLSPFRLAVERREQFVTLTQQVSKLIGSLHPDVPIERRSYERVAVPYLFQLTPLDADGQQLVSATITVVGKDLSSRGLSFFHERPLLFRRGIVSIQHAKGVGFAAEIDIRWCRFAKVGWYESGGRLLHAVGRQDYLAEAI